MLIYCVVVVGRPNLYLSVCMKGDVIGDLQSQMVHTGGKLQFEGPTIIYCPTKKATEDVYSKLQCEFSVKIFILV